MLDVGGREARSTPDALSHSRSGDQSPQLGHGRLDVVRIFLPLLGVLIHIIARPASGRAVMTGRTT
jgi:hypothetical protein